MPSAVDQAIAIEPALIERAVGGRSFQRGQAYAHGGRVLGIDWDAETNTLTGSVLGNGATYETVAFFVVGHDGSLRFDDGECTCPVGYNCKHVAAIALVAGGASNTPARGRARVSERSQREDFLLHLTPSAGDVRSSARGVRLPSAEVRSSPAEAPVDTSETWERTLTSLIAGSAAATGEHVGMPLAIELAYDAHGAGSRRAPRLLARPMREGARGDWIKGSLAWSTLEPWRPATDDLREQHVTLLRELHALHRAAQGRHLHYSSYGSEKTLDLSGLDSVHLWSLLEEAQRIGIALVHADAELGEVRLQRRGELVLDVVAEAAGVSRLSCALRADGQPLSELEPLLFLGDSGHGLLCAERVRPGDADADADAEGTSVEVVEARRLSLVRLARPAPPELQRMLLAREQLSIPYGELQRFAEDICPALRGVATVISSDGSFTVPEVSAPSLTFGARFGVEHELELHWQWLYQVGSSSKHVPLGIDGPGFGFRDRRAEQELLASTDLSDTGVERFGVLDASGRPSGGGTRLAGIASMRFATEVLPRLWQRSDLTVEVLGESPDYRDVGGTLTLGFSTKAIAGERDWFDLGVSVSVEGRELPFADVFAALAGGESRMLLDDGAHFSLLTPELQELRRLIEEARMLTDEPASSLRISRYQAAFWEELVALGVVTEQAQTWRAQVQSLLGLHELRAPDLPTALHASLRPYQRDGFGWLASLWELELGGVLADDMGLGKTLQALALICHARQRDPRLGPFLIVAPTSVVPGWASEAARFAPSLSVAAVTDTLARSGNSIEQLAEHDVLVTTYTLLRLDADSYGSVEWAGLILDEAQYVKNHQGKTYKCIRELPVAFKLALTGTPMENNLMELWSLLSIVAPGLFPEPKRFADQYAKPIEREGDSVRLERLRRRIKPLMKRRSKELVAADLPAEQEQTLKIDLQAKHRKLYDTQLQRERQKVLRLLGDFDRNRLTILRSITLLRQLSLHPALLDAKHDKLPCAKLNTLVEQLSDVRGGGHRALVFSQFTSFLRMARTRLEAEGVSCCYLDGRTRKRSEVIERFKAGGDDVFLISLKAGGFGLNLTEADYCFLLDPWWNPAAEAQAIDRTHRIGQTRQVMVYRLISRGTIEEKVLALARRKAALFTGVMDDGDLFAGAITAEDVRGLLE